MSITRKTNLTVLTICAFTVTIASVATYINKLAPTTNIATVTITAPRLTEQEKIAFDVEQGRYPMQTVLIAAKRLTAEEKFAFDQQDRQIQQAKVRAHKKPQLLV